MATEQTTDSASTAPADCVDDPEYQEPPPTKRSHLKRKAADKQGKRRSKRSKQEFAANESGLHTTNSETFNKYQEKDAPSVDEEETMQKQDGPKVLKWRIKRETEGGEEEKRLRKWRPKAPVTYHNIFNRAMSQRMFVLDRNRTGTIEEPEETIVMAGTTGNIYTVVIGKVPSCSCPHARKGNHCKHIVYVLVRTLKAPVDLQYQLAFLSSELRTIFAGAPGLPCEAPDADTCESGGKRKPIEDDCPICCEALDTNAAEEIVWCRAACGNNVHRVCFEQWAAQKRANGGVTCPFCRTPWQGDMSSLKHIATTATLGEDGYANVASQLGLSGVRDYSTYHPHWVRRQRRYGYINDEDPDYDDGE